MANINLLLMNMVLLIVYISFALNILKSLGCLYLFKWMSRFYCIFWSSFWTWSLCSGICFGKFGSSSVLMNFSFEMLRIFSELAFPDTTYWLLLLNIISWISSPGVLPNGDMLFLSLLFLSKMLVNGNFYFHSNS